MKKINFLMMAVAVVLCFSSCNNEEPVSYTTVDFENVALGDNGVWNGSDLSGTAKSEESYGSSITNYYGSFTSSICSFANVYTSDWASWTGFACSNNVDTATVGYTNQYSVWAGAGANSSSKFGVAYSSASMTISNTTDYELKSIMLCNSVYAYRSLAYAENGCKVLADGDYFMVTITGKNGETTVGSVDYYLADYRDGKTFINSTWTEVDLSTLATASTLEFSFSGTDSNSYGLMTPSYVCIDNVKFENK